MISPAGCQLLALPYRDAPALLHPLPLRHALPGLVAAYLALPTVTLRQSIHDPCDMVAWADLDPSDRELAFIATLLRERLRELLSEDCEDCAEQERHRWHDESWTPCTYCGDTHQALTGPAPRVLTHDGCMCVSCGMLVDEQENCCPHCVAEFVVDVPRLELGAALEASMARPVNDTVEEGA